MDRPVSTQSFPAFYERGSMDTPDRNAHHESWTAVYLFRNRWASFRNISILQPLRSRTFGSSTCDGAKCIRPTVESEPAPSLGEGDVAAEHSLSGIRMEGKVGSLPGFWDQIDSRVVNRIASHPGPSMPSRDAMTSRTECTTTQPSGQLAPVYPPLADIREVGRRHRPTRPRP